MGACLQLQRPHWSGRAAGALYWCQPDLSRTSARLSGKLIVHAGLVVQEDDLDARYEAAEAAEVEEGWTALYESALVYCMHGGNCAQGDACQVPSLLPA